MKHARKPLTAEERREQRAKLREKKENKKKGKGFRIFLLIWVLIIVAFGGYALHYVKGVLKEMQANAPSQFVADRIAELSDAQIRELFEFNDSEDEGDQIINVRQFFKDGSYTVKQVMGTEDYNIYNGERKVLTVSLNKLKSVSKLAIFNYNLYELKNIAPSEDKELYHYEITAPSDCTVALNGKELQPTSTATVENFADASDYVDLPAENKYMLDHLTKPADIKITQNGADVAFKMSEKIAIENSYEKLKS